MRRQLAVRAAIPQLCLALLAAAALVVVLASAITQDRMWLSVPPPSAQIAGPPAANNSPALPSRLAPGKQVLPHTRRHHRPAHPNPKNW